MDIGHHCRKWKSPILGVARVVFCDVFLVSFFLAYIEPTCFFSFMSGKNLQCSLYLTASGRWERDRLECQPSLFMCLPSSKVFYPSSDISVDCVLRMWFKCRWNMILWLPPRAIGMSLMMGRRHCPRVARCCANPLICIWGGDVKGRISTSRFA